MNHPLTVLLVEDDPLICQKYEAFAKEFNDITLVSITNDSQKALQDIQDYLPNVIILDLELHTGSGSGLDVLRGLKNMSLEISPYILVATNNTSSVTYEYARQLGADYILSKHQGDYSEQNTLNFLRLMKEAIIGKYKTSPQQAYTTEAPLEREQRILRRIKTELNQIGINPKFIGYQYLTEAIQLIIEEPRQCLCGIIAKKHNKTDSSVERAMITAINKAWRSSDIDDLLCHYTAKISSERGVPTLTEFIYYYAEKIKNEY